MLPVYEELCTWKSDPLKWEFFFSFSLKKHNLPETFHFVGLAGAYMVVRSGIKPVDLSFMN